MLLQKFRYASSTLLELEDGNFRKSLFVIRLYNSQLAFRKFQRLYGSLGTGVEFLRPHQLWLMLGPRKLLPSISVQLQADKASTRESQVWISSSVSTTREKAKGILRIAKESEVALGCPANQAFSIWSGSIVTLVSVLAVEVTSIKTRVCEY